MSSKELYEKLLDGSITFDDIVKDEYKVVLSDIKNIYYNDKIIELAYKKYHNDAVRQFVDAIKDDDSDIALYFRTKFIDNTLENAKKLCEITNTSFKDIKDENLYQFYYLIFEYLNSCYKDLLHLCDKDVYFKAFEDVTTYNYDKLCEDIKNGSILFVLKLLYSMKSNFIFNEMKKVKDKVNLVFSLNSKKNMVDDIMNIIGNFKKPAGSNTIYFTVDLDEDTDIFDVIEKLNKLNDLL